MGACSSCLGLERHPSQEVDETDPLLDDQNAQYGGIGGGDVLQQDEEELRREREALERITNEATDNMIDVLHPSNTELGQRFAQTSSQRSTPRTGTPENAGEEHDEAQDEESKWLKSIQAAISDITAVKGLHSSSLVLDTSQLKSEAPTSAPRKSTKGKLPA